MKFDRHIGSSAADVPVELKSDTIIQTTNLAALRLHEILRYDVEDWNGSKAGSSCRKGKHDLCLKKHFKFELPAIVISLKF